jgi:hypothetical protein
LRNIRLDYFHIELDSRRQRNSQLREFRLGYG